MREDIKLALKFEGRTENARVRSGYSRVLRAGLRTKVDPRLPIQVKSLGACCFSHLALQKDVSLRFSNLLRYYWG